jgi:hypothetical protein
MDLSKLSTEDLLALQSGDLSKVSTDGLKALQGQQSVMTAQQPSFKETIQASVPGRVVQGMRDPIDTAAEILPKALSGITSLGGIAENPVSRFFGSEAERVQAMNKANEQAYQQARMDTGSTGVDASRFIGNVISPANAAIASKLPVAATTAGKVIQGAGLGAIGGTLGGQADVSSPDYWQEKGKQALVGGLMGAAIPAVVAGGARIIRPETNQKAVELLKQGVTPTPGQILGGTAANVEEKLQSVPVLGDVISRAKGQAVQDFNKTALNRAVEPIGETVDQVGREGVKQVKDKLSAAYNNLLPKIGFKPDQQFQQEYGNLQQMVSGLGEKEQGRFNSIMNDVFSKASPNGSMTGETFKIVESKLSNEAKKFASSGDAYQRELGDALNEGLRIMRDTLPRVNPGFSDQLSSINKGYAMYSVLRNAASSTATGAREGIFTPAQLAQAVRASDRSAGKGASATGQALMQDLAEQGTNILGSKVPDSGTAGRLLTTGGIGGAALATGNVAPVLAGLGIGSAPYLARKLTANILTKRPADAAKLADALRRQAPLLAGGIPLAVENQ